MESVDEFRRELITSFGSVDIGLACVVSIDACSQSGILFLEGDLLFVGGSLIHSVGCNETSRECDCGKQYARGDCDDDLSHASA